MAPRWTMQDIEGEKRAQALDQELAQVRTDFNHLMNVFPKLHALARRHLRGRKLYTTQRKISAVQDKLCDLNDGIVSELTQQLKTRC